MIVVRQALTLKTGALYAQIPHDSGQFLFKSFFITDDFESSRLGFGLQFKTAVRRQDQMGVGNEQRTG